MDRPGGTVLVIASVVGAGPAIGSRSVSEPMGAFSHNDAHFTLEHIEGLKLANRVPAGEDTFLGRIAAASPYTSKFSPRELVS